VRLLVFFLSLSFFLVVLVLFLGWFCGVFATFSASHRPSHHPPASARDHFIPVHEAPVESSGEWDLPGFPAPGSMLLVLPPVRSYFAIELDSLSLNYRSPSFFDSRKAPSLAVLYSV